MTPGPAASEVALLAARELALCGVGPGTVVVVCTNPETVEPLGGACLAGVQALAAEGAQLVLPSLALESEVAGPARRAVVPETFVSWLGQADLVVDATARGLLHSSLQRSILEAGARMLRVREPAEVLARLFPSEDVRRLVEASRDALEGSAEVVLSSPHGTALRLSVGERVVSTQYGYVDTPGRWDQWGTALVAGAPMENSTEGTLVLWPGDIVFLSATVGRYVTEPCRLRIEGGAITDVEGGPEAALITDLLLRWPEADARRAAHVGWGCDTRADWYALERYRATRGGGADVRSVAGGVVLAFGANEDLGGANRTTAHADLALRDTSVTVDGTQVVRVGALCL